MKNSKTKKIIRKAIKKIINETNIDISTAYYKEAKYKNKKNKSYKFKYEISEQGVLIVKFRLYKENKNYKKESPDK